MHSASRARKCPFGQARQVWPFTRPTGWAWAWQEASLQDFKGGSGSPTSPTFQSSGQHAGGQAQDGLNIPSELTETREHKTLTKCTRSAPSKLLPDKWKSEMPCLVQLNKTNMRRKPIQTEGQALGQVTLRCRDGG